MGQSDPNADFFAELPRDELTPLETTLRQALFGWIETSWHKEFPITEWIERRVGGEFDTRRDDRGHTVVFLRGSAPPVAAENPPPALVPPAQTGSKGNDSRTQAFFRTLPADRFSDQEEELRDKIFDFLAAWQESTLADLADLSKDATVQKCQSKFLPKEVSLGDWIEKRIGGEIELRREGGNPRPIVHLSPAAQVIVAEKFKRMGTSLVEKRMEAYRSARAEKEKMSVQAMEFFKTLPEDELMPEELALRDALFDFIRREKERRGGKKPIVTAADFGQDPAIQRCRVAFLPKTVQMREWIDQRIGGEVETRNGPKDQYHILLRDGVDPPSTHGHPDRQQGNAMSADDFFASLPGDSLTDEEAKLRLILLGMLEDASSVPFPQVAKDSDVAKGSTALLPRSVPLHQWIKGRVGGEITVSSDSRGQFIMMKTGSEPAVADGGSEGGSEPAGAEDGGRGDSGAAGTRANAEAREKLREDFFASLPADSFSPEEEDLRDTLLAFLGQWSQEEPPSLQRAIHDPEISRARPKVLPKDSKVSLKDWIERRIGGEMEMALDPRGSGQWLFGLRGSLELPPASAAKKRRKR